MKGIAGIVNLSLSSLRLEVLQGVAGPLFTGGRLKNEYRASLASRDQARITFEKEITQAFGEVSTALSARQQLAKAYQEEQRSVEAYRDSVRLPSIRYDSGLSSYFEIVDAQIELYPAESTMVNYDLGRKLALVDLYRALGGGWNLSDSDWIGPKSPTASKEPHENQQPAAPASR